jgi:hypothetical protein
MIAASAGRDVFSGDDSSLQRYIWPDRADCLDEQGVLHVGHEAQEFVLTTRHTTGGELGSSASRCNFG